MYNLPTGYLSVSQIKLLVQCGLKYEKRYVEGKRTPSNYAASIGSATHKGLEFFYKEKIKGTVLPSQTVLDYAITGLEEYIKVDTAEANILKNVIPPYIDKVAIDVIPLEVEKEIKYTAKCGVDILGFIDLLTEKAVCDYKITDKKWALPKVQSDIQFISYCVATGLNTVNIHNITKTDGSRSKSGEGDNVRDIANIRLLNWDFTPRDYWFLDTVIERAAKTISSGSFMPCDPTAWCCNEKWCDYWKECRGG